MKKRFLSLLTILTMLLTMSGIFGMPIAAEVVESSYPSATQVKQYPDEDGYTIATAEELAALAGLVAEGYDFDGATIYITADLDFSGYDTWTPIGYLHHQSGGTADAESYPFRGNINGLFHRFENIDLEMSGPFQALFGYMEGATIENIILAEGEMRSDDYRLGALVCLLKNGEARNIESHLSLSSTSTKNNLNMGLFSLTYDVEIECIAVYGTIGDPNLNTAQQNGGISGCGYDAATTIRHSFVPATIYGNEVFQIGQRCVIENCPLVGSKEMPEADFLGGRAAWILNTAGGTKAHSGLWSNGADGPTLRGNAPIYKAEAIALTSEGDEIGVYDLYVGKGQEVAFPTIEGYTFSGATLDNEPIPAGWEMPAADQELLLRYEPKTYFITYQLNGGAASAELPLEYRMGKRVLLPTGDLLSKEGFRFAGWYRSEDFSGNPLYEISADLNEDLVLYAKWATPIEIATPEQLCALSEGDLLGCYVLMADIDLSGYDYAPIGSKEAPFYGSFDGNGYTISGLNIQSQEDYQGLFGYNAGYIENVTLSENCSIRGKCYVGALAGYNAGRIENCISNATVGATTTPNKQYKLMSQNLCIWGNQYDIVSVEERQPWMVDRIREQDPDFIGFQEGSPAWVEYLSEHITDTYTFMYQYREPESSSSKESAPIAYKTADFDLLDSGVFWLSETPDECSKGWDASHWRICHWMILRDKENGQKIGIYNTHFDLTNRSRKGEAQVIQARLQQAIAEHPDMMILACGDFNTEAGTEPYEIMNSGGMVDARYIAPVTTDEYTHTKGAGWGDGERSIDHIFGYGERMIFDEFDVLNELSPSGKRLSDHNGVLAKFRSLRGRMVGGMIGGNSGEAKGLLMAGNVSGADKVGLLIGEDLANADYLYAKSGSLPIKGSGSEATHSDADLQNELNALSFLWGLNQAIGKDAFTLRDQQAALLGQRADGIPVKITDRNAEKYALSGSCYQIDTAGFQNPVCFVDGEKIEGSSFIVPQKSCVVAVEEGPNCPPHSYGEWQYSSEDEEHHYRYCQFCDEKQIGYHTMDDGVYYEATCTEKDFTRYTCELCGWKKDIEGKKQPLGHSYGPWALAKEETDEEQGFYLRECATCQEQEKRIIPCKSDPYIYGELREIDAEGNAIVDIKIANNPIFSGTTIEILYDGEALNPDDKIETGEVLSDGMPMSYIDRQNCVIRLAVISFEPLRENGRIATLNLKVEEGVKRTVLEINVDNRQTIKQMNEAYQQVIIYGKDFVLEADPDHVHNYTWTDQEGYYYCDQFLCRRLSPCSPHNDDSYARWEKVDEKTHIRYCKTDSQHYQVADHRFDEGVYHAATCTEDEYTQYTCLDCGYEKDEKGQQTALGHTYGDWAEVDGNTHIRTCANDPQHQEKEQHRFDKGIHHPVTCTEDEYTHYTCLDCGYEMDEIGERAQGHPFGEWQYVNEEYHIRYCTANSDHREKAYHNIDNGVYHKATCTSKDFTRYTCTVCKWEKDIEGKKQPLGHSYGPWILEKEGTEDEQGYYLRKCATCQEQEKRIIPCENDPYIYGELREIDAEGNAIVDIKIKNNPGFMGTVLEVGYDSEILMPEDNVEIGTMLSGGLTVPNVDHEAKKIRFVVISAKQFKNDGTLITLRFKVKKDVAETMLSIWVDPMQTVSEQNQLVSIYEKDLYLKADPNHSHEYQWEEEIGAYICSHFFCVDQHSVSMDLNDDGKADTLDAILLLRHLLGGQEMEKPIADVNRDGKVGLQDVVFFLRYINKME